MKLSLLEQKTLMNIQLGVNYIDTSDYYRAGHILHSQCLIQYSIVLFTYTSRLNCLMLRHHITSTIRDQITTTQHLDYITSQKLSNQINYGCCAPLQASFLTYTQLHHVILMHEA